MDGKLTFGKEKGGLTEAEVQMTPNMDQTSTNAYSNPEKDHAYRRERPPNQGYGYGGKSQRQGVTDCIVHEDWICNSVSKDAYLFMACSVVVQISQNEAGVTSARNIDPKTQKSSLYSNRGHTIPQTGS